MKRKLTYVLGILLCMAQVGCLDDSYTGTVYVEDHIEEGTLHEVRMTIGESKEINPALQSKGSGVIEGVSDLAEKSFYVYAFNKDIHTDYSLLNVQDSLRCLIDGTYDDPETLMGRRAIWDPNTETVEWGVEESPIYYPTGDDQGHDYDFFAYYIDNIVPDNSDIQRNESDIKIDIEIDGCQDIMSAKAKPTALQLDAIKDEREMLYQKEHCYGYYTASRNLHPNFDFIHHLVKLDFKLVPGGTPGMTKDVTVEKIEVRSKYKAEFTVADKYDENRLGLKFLPEDNPDTTRLVLREPDGSEYVPRLISTIDQVGSVTEGTIDDLGSLLVAPDDDYYLYIVLAEVNGDIVLEGKENITHVFYGKDENNKIPFTAGSEYMITLTIYGQMDVKVSAEIGEWDEGGDYEYDYDDTTRPGYENN